MLDLAIPFQFIFIHTALAWANWLLLPFHMGHKCKCIFRSLAQLYYYSFGNMVW